MDEIRSIFSDKWIRRFSVLFLVLGLSFFLATACNDDDCFFGQIDFAAVENEAECEQFCFVNLCDDCEFVAPNECTGIDCAVCEIIEDI
ncbi:MAG TPA: hypothetical protein VI935_07700 [Thermodesulfobacteriota bacterium]|nr:hypothetical protein [Thermodesulfobacteriota bacterium]